MDEATGRQEMEQRLIERSLRDDDFRQQLLADPRVAVEQELGTRLPEDLRVVAVEETSDTIYLVLPPASSAGPADEGLSDQDLDAVAGGGTWVDNTCGGQTVCDCGPTYAAHGKGC